MLKKYNKNISCKRFNTFLPKCTPMAGGCFACDVWLNCRLWAIWRSWHLTSSTARKASRRRYSAGRRWWWGGGRQWRYLFQHWRRADDVQIQHQELIYSERSSRLLCPLLAFAFVYLPPLACWPPTTTLLLTVVDNCHGRTLKMPKVIFFGLSFYYYYFGDARG